MTGEQLYDDIYALSDYLWMEYNQRIDAVARPRIEWLAKKAWLRRERDADVVALLNERYSIGSISRLYDPRTPVELLNANVQLVRHRLAGLEWNARFRETYERIGMYWATVGVPAEMVPARRLSLTREPETSEKKATPSKAGAIGL